MTERPSDPHNMHGDPDGDVEADTASGGPPEPAEPPQTRPEEPDAPPEPTSGDGDEDAEGEPRDG